jgi:hypothetical protein
MSQAAARVDSPSSVRTTGELVKAIAEDTSTLVRKEVELAKEELAEAAKSRVKGAAALAVAWGGRAFRSVVPGCGRSLTRSPPTDR